MSLTVACFIPTGIVLSGDSRSTSTYYTKESNPNDPSVEIEYANGFIASDSESKVFLVFEKYGVTACGDGLIDDFPIQYHIDQFEIEYTNPTDDVKDLATALKNYFSKFNPIPFLFFFVAGYEKAEQFVYRISLTEDEVIRINYDDAHDKLKYDVQYDGNFTILDRLLTSIPSDLSRFHLFNLQDAVDYSKHLILTTINQMKFELEFPSVGGQIDILVITKNKAEFVARKQLRG